MVKKINKKNSSIKLIRKQSSLKINSTLKPFKKVSYEKRKRNQILKTGLTALGLTALGALIYNKYKKKPRNTIQNYI